MLREKEDALLESGDWDEADCPLQAQRQVDYQIEQLWNLMKKNVKHPPSAYIVMPGSFHVVSGYIIDRI
jgi:hypothetical protein